MFCEIDGAWFHYVDIGKGKPVLLLHGYPLDHAVMAGCMEPVFEKYSGYRRIYIDLPGMGTSEAPMTLASSDAILDFLCKFIGKTVDGSFLLAGESYGGYLAQALLSRMPERVAGMLLLCPVVYPEPVDRTVPKHFPRFPDERYLRRLSEQERAEFCKSTVVTNEKTHTRYRAEVAPGLGRANKDFTAMLRQNYACTFDVVAANRKLRYSRPVLLLAGRQDDCVGYQDLWGLLEDYPRATFAVLDRASHNLQFEQSELFTMLARDWLRRTELE